jgi:RNA polymerase sigma-70 factor (ECF subfamily)
MERTAQGDEEAFRLLVERWEAPILRFLERMLDGREEARDVGQETFVRVYREARRYRPQGQFRSWLYRVAGNLARGRLRRRRILHWVPFDIARHDRPQPAARPDEHYEREDVRAAVREALEHLPDRQREAVLLRRYAGLSHGEIAAAMGTSIPGIESLLQRAMTGLRRELNRRGLEP